MMNEPNEIACESMTISQTPTKPFDLVIINTVDPCDVNAPHLITTNNHLCGEKLCKLEMN